MKTDPKTKDEVRTTKNSDPPRRLKIKTSTEPKPPEPREPCTVSIW